MKKILLMLLGVLLALPVVARDFTYTYEGQTLTYTVIDEDAKTCMTKAGTYFEYTQIHKAGNQVSGDLVIPSKVTDGEVIYTVTSLGEYAFSNRSGLTSVTIPSSVTTIGKEAFWWCSGLKKAEFASVEVLCKIDFNDEVSNPLYYAHNLYINGEEITDLVIPKGVTLIGNCAFSGCSGLTSVTIPSSVTTIGHSAFVNCSGLTSVTIPEGVTSIGNSVFSSCSGLTSVSIPSSVTTIGRSAFWDCLGLEKAEFASVEALCKIDFSTDFSNPLYYAHNLSINGEEIKDLVIPAGVTSIGDCAFQGCSGLTSVTIPSSVTTIGEDAFRDCSGLEKAEFASVEALCKIDFKDTSSNPLYCAHNLYINGKKITDLVIPAGVTSIGNSVFSGCSGLTSVTIPPSVTTIGRSAFFYCRGLKSVTIPEGVTSIGSRAFENCSGLTSVYYGADKPINANADIFSQETYKKAILYMSEDGVVFSRLDPWKNFRNIEEYDFSTGIDDVITDFNENAPYEIYNINGVKAGDNINALSPGLYIIRQGKTVKKIMVK